MAVKPFTKKAAAAPAKPAPSKPPAAPPVSGGKKPPKTPTKTAPPPPEPEPEEEVEEEEEAEEGPLDSPVADDDEIPEDDPDSEGLVMDLDFSNAKDEEDLERGEVFPAGWYHCEVDEVKSMPGSSPGETPVKNPAVIISFRVLDGQPDDPNIEIDDLKNRVHQEWMHITPKTMPRLKLFAYRLGASPENAFGTVAKTDWRKAQGRQCVVTIEESEYQGRAQARIAWTGIYKIDDPDVADVPKDADALAAIGASGKPKRGRSGFDDMAK